MQNWSVAQTFHWSELQKWSVVKTFHWSELQKWSVVQTFHWSELQNSTTVSHYHRSHYIDNPWLICKTNFRVCQIVTNPYDFGCLKLRDFGCLNLTDFVCLNVTDFGCLSVVRFSMFLIGWGAESCCFGKVYLICFPNIGILHETLSVQGDLNWVLWACLTGEIVPTQL